MSPIGIIYLFGGLIPEDGSFELHHLFRGPMETFSQGLTSVLTDLSRDPAGTWNLSFLIV